MKKYLTILIIAINIFINSLIINAQQTYKIYYLENNKEEQLDFDEYIFLGDFMEDKKIELLLKTYFYNDKKINYIPKDTKILNIKVINKDLFINFNQNIKNYGGNHYETNLIRQILHNCFQFDKIQTVTFLIEGKFEVLPEGHLVFKYTREDLEIMDYNQNISLKN